MITRLSCRSETKNIVFVLKRTCRLTSVFGESGGWDSQDSVSAKPHQTVWILLNAFSFELNRINLYICQVSLADGASRIQEVKNCPTTLSPAFHSIGTNVLAIHMSFCVKQHTDIRDLRGYLRGRKRIRGQSSQELTTLATKKTHGYLMTRLGYYDGKYVVSVIADPQTVSEASYLCLIDRATSWQ